MNISELLATIADAFWGWPLLIFIAIVGVITTIGLYFVQFRYFLTSVQLVLAPKKLAAGESKIADEMTPFQAFINTLGASIGNGTIAGLATALYAGGPGAVFWMVVMATIGMALRFAEVYLGTCYIGKYKFGNATGGPLVYLSLLPFGAILPYIYASIFMIYALTGGNAIQCNSIGLGLERTWNIAPIFTAMGLFAFIAYALLGGAKRILRLSDILVPVKVGVFMVAAIIVLGYHYQAIIPALALIFKGAFSPISASGALVGLSVQAAVSAGLSRSIFANEAGLGSAGMLFGATEGKSPAKDGVMAMLGVFITTHIIGLIFTLCIIASGVWDNGQTSTTLSIAAFETVFGVYGGWIISFLALSFGLSVLVSYAFLTRECFFFLTNGRFTNLFTVLYCAVAFFGTILSVHDLFNISGIINALLLILNLVGILYLLQDARKGVKSLDQAR